MLGNVKEWVADCWNKTHRGQKADAKARRSVDFSMRVVLAAPGTGNRRSVVWHREGNTAATAYFNYGFRVAPDL